MGLTVVYDVERLDVYMCVYCAVAGDCTRSRLNVNSGDCPTCFRFRH
jgi:hypothetical protein